MEMITEFYEDSEIFITGGSGVVGKAAIEKLLRSCNVKKIYILLRCKRGTGTEDRLREIKNSRMFKVLKETKPNELDKLVAVPGDIAEDGLGISDAYKDLLRNVSIFFHSAATTRFNEPLKTAILLNLKSTYESIKLAETFSKLKIFIHVSTFFCNPFVRHIEDKIYPGVFDWKKAMQLLEPEYEAIEPHMDAITDKLITGFPNTYTFTKHLAEQLVNDYRSKLPIAIYRPSIVVSALEEPEPGYTETMVGVMGLILVWGTGLIKVLRCKANLLLDVTPLDSGTKHLLMFTARTGRLSREKFTESIPVGMFSSRGLCEHSLHELGINLSRCMTEQPYDKSVWIPGLQLTTCPFIYGMKTFFLQIIPALLVDLILKIFGQKPFMMKIQRKIYFTMKMLNFFLTEEFSSNGITDLEVYSQIGKGNDFDLKALLDSCKNQENLNHTAKMIAKGCRKYLLKEEECTLPRARKVMIGKIVVYNVIRALILFLVVRAMYRRAMRYMNQ